MQVNKMKYKEFAAVLHWTTLAVRTIQSRCLHSCRGDKKRIARKVRQLSTQDRFLEAHPLTVWKTRRKNIRLRRCTLIIVSFLLELIGLTYCFTLIFLQCLNTSEALQYHRPFCCLEVLVALISPLSTSLTRRVRPPTISAAVVLQNDLFAIASKMFSRWMAGAFTFFMPFSLLRFYFLRLLSSQIIWSL